MTIEFMFQELKTKIKEYDKINDEYFSLDLTDNEEDEYVKKLDKLKNEIVDILIFVTKIDKKTAQTMINCYRDKIRSILNI